MADLLGRSIASLMGIFSPRAALSYLQRRAALLSYAAARRDGPNKNWLPCDLDIDRMNRKDRELVQARARDIGMNTAVAGALDRIVANVVYTGIRPQVDIPHPNGGRDCEACSGIETLWARWARQVEMWEMQQLVLRHLWLDGGCIVHRYIDRDLARRGLPPINLELIDLSRLNTQLFGTLPGGNTVEDGIEYRGYKPVALHVLKRPLPGTFATSLDEDVRLPLEDCRLVMTRRRIGQSVPMSWLAAVIMTVHNLDAYLSVEEIAARVAAAFCVIVELPDQGDANPLNGIPTASMSGGTGTDGSRIPKFIDAGRIDTIPAGAKLNTVNPGRPGTTFEPYLRASNRRISSGLGISYEAYSNDYTGASYSSARSASLEERRAYRMQQRVLVEKFLSPVWDWFCDGLALSGALSHAQDGTIPVNWQLPGWSWVDPAKDAAASEKNLELKLVSRTELCAEQGRDFSEVLARLSEEKRMIEDAGLSPEIVDEAVTVTDKTQGKDDEDEEDQPREDKE